jgi:dienelactone hydrolase
VNMLHLLLCMVRVMAHGPNDKHAYKTPEEVEWPPIPSTPLVTHDVDYEIDGVPYQGYVAYPAGNEGRTLPGIMISHQYLGLGQMEKFRTNEMAAYNYVAFAGDLYGKNTRPRNPAEAIAMLTALRANPFEYHKRTEVAFRLLRSFSEHGSPRVNSSALFANGYCMGGGTSLEVARTNMGALGVSAFHGTLPPLLTNLTERVSSAVQVHHALSDGDQSLLTMESELRGRGTQVWETMKYGNTNHGWTGPDSAVYNPQAAWSAHASMRQFYDYLQGKRV